MADQPAPHQHPVPGRGPAARDPQSPAPGTRPPARTHVTLSVNGQPVTVESGTVVSTAVALAGGAGFRRSVTGESRGPLCGMGICFECRVAIDGREHCRSCQIPCAEGMKVRTDA